MKKLLVASFLLAGIMGANAQNVASTPTLTSGGNLAGTGGSGGTYYGYQAGKITTGTINTFIGNNAGLNNTTGRKNLFSGNGAGYSNTTAHYNVYLGAGSGNRYSTGTGNTFTGFNSGNGVDGDFQSDPTAPGTHTGSNNSFYGNASGRGNSTGNENVFFGSNAGLINLTGSKNTYLGFSSGSNNKGANNIFIGSNSGPISPNQLGAIESDKLYIDNLRSNTPLIWGDFAANQLKFNGTVGIGAVTTYPTNPLYANYKLFVTGGILTDEVRVALNASGTWADYVFAKDYDLKPLSEVEKFINTNGHLPNVPSAAQVKEEGINIGDMARIQQEKIEELTLYIIAQNKRIEALEAKMNNK